MARNSGDWLGEGIAVLDLCNLPREISSEDVRAILRENGIGEPHHPNAWGALMRKLAMTRNLRIVGYVKSSLPSAHSRRVALWGMN